MKTVVNNPISKGHKLVAQLLLVIFILESCHNTNLPVHPQLEQAIKSSTHPVTFQTIHDNHQTERARSGSISQNLDNPIQAIEKPVLIHFPHSSTHPGIIEQKDTTIGIKDNPIEVSTSHEKKSPAHHNYNRLPIVKSRSASKQTNTRQVTTPHVHTKSVTNKQGLLASQKASAGKRVLNQQFNSNHDVSRLLQSQVYIVKGGSEVRFEKKKDGKLQAIVENKFATGFTRHILPVIIQTGVKYSETAVKNPAWQKQCIHVTKDYVYIGHMGLLGGGKGKTSDAEPQGNEKNEASYRKTACEHKIKKVQAFIEEAAKNAQKAKGKHMVLVIGNTGAGKSTIINYLLGSELEQTDNDEGDLIAVVKNPQKEWAKIGHTLKSETFLPSVHSNPSSPYAYCDCSGFNDTRTEEERLNTTIATQLIINAAERIQGIIIVIDVLDLTHGRGKGMRDLSLTLSQLLKGKEMQNSILFVFNDKIPSRLNLKKALENIHKKIDNLEKTETEKLEKLAKSAETDSHASSEEYASLCQSLSMLKMINDNKNTTLKIDIFDAFESKSNIETLLQGIQAMPKEDFNFSQYDDTRVKFNMQLAEIVGDISSKLLAFLQANENISINNEKLESCEERIKFYQTQIALFKPGHKIKNEEKIPVLRQHIETYNQKIETLQQKRSVRLNIISNLMQEKDRLDTNEEFLYWRQACTVNQIWWRDKRRFTFEYNGVPFSRFEHNHKTIALYRLSPGSDAHGNFTYSSNQDIGFHQATFAIDLKSVYLCLRPKNLSETFAEVKIYVKKKELPINKACIEQINNQLMQEQKMIEERDKEINEVQLSRKTSEDLLACYTTEVEKQRKEIVDRKQYLEKELGRIQREKKEATLKNTEQEKIRQEAAKYLAAREGLINAVYNLISMNITDSESRLMEKFKEYYHHYRSFLNQGPSYISSLVERNFPEYLLCPLRSEVFVDPVMTRCGHTFSQQELLGWLRRKATCPTCREPIIENDLRPNLNIAQAIEEFEKSASSI